MLSLNITVVPEMWDPKNREFIPPVITTINLEHSLISISKWESKWHKPFLTKEPKTREETLDYIRCMTLTQNVNPEVYEHIDNDAIDKVNAYIEDPMTATTFKDMKGKGSGGRQIVTSELIYYDMITYNIPVQFEKWHLSRLMTLIRVCAEKNKTNNKMSSTETMRRNSELNRLRRAKYNTKG